MRERRHAGEEVVLRGVPTTTRARTIDAPRTILDDHAWLAASESRRDAPTLRARWDGNRGAIVDAPRVRFDGRDWLLSIKGIGARAPLYGDTPAGYAHAHELDPAAGPFDAEEHAHHGRSLLGAITRESWMGEAPYGGQGADNADNALLLSSPGLREALAPAVLCPVIGVVEVPSAEIADVFHYRRHHGPVVQEHRLVPSAVRLYHQSAVALGKDVEEALAVLGVETPEALDAFLDRFLATGIAAITIAARSARVHGGTYEVLDFDDAWLDKDAFIAPDGTIAFADLEALTHVHVEDVAALGARVRRQVERNAYEVLYGVDALLRVEERWRDRPRDVSSRRRVLAERTMLALAGDPVASLERCGEGWDLVLRPRVGERTSVRWLDER